MMSTAILDETLIPILEDREDRVEIQSERRPRRSAISTGDG